MSRANARSLFFLVAILFFDSQVSAQDKLLTLDDLYDPEKRVNFSGNPPAKLTWLDDRHYLKGASKVNALTGEAAPLFDAAKMESALSKLAGISADDAKQIVAQIGARPQLSADRAAALINYANDLFYYKFGSAEAVRLTNTADEEVGEEFSPDGKMVSFVKNYNIYFSGTERSHIGGDAYRIKLDGSGLQRLTEAPGTHNTNFNPSFSHFIDTWSDATTPAQVRLHSADGKLVRVIDENKVAALAQYRSSKPEFLQVKTRDGFVMEAMMIKPPGFDPKKKYPVFQHTYSGPHAPQVRNAWGRDFMWHQLLAQKGYIVWICDNRSASGKGIESAWPIYKNLGELELRDLEDSVTYLKTLPYVDSSRIGLNGWSYGGYMTSFALTHSTTWKVGIVGAPVTDWHLYDTIYTERYMATPQNNPEGYEKSSVVRAANNFNGKMLLIHGAIDDNVHIQNSIQFIYVLQKAGKQFEFMIYPKSRHGVTDPLLVRHMRELMLRFILENL